MIQSLRDQYELIDKEFSDPRTKNKFLVASPFPILGIIFAYVLLTKYIIPTYMKYRKAVEIKNVIIAYDVLQILLNIHITYVSLCSGYSRRYSLFRCRDLDFSSTDPDALTAMEAVYVYYINKIIEFSDTVTIIYKCRKLISSFSLNNHSFSNVCRKCRNIQNTRYENADSGQIPLVFTQGLRKNHVKHPQTEESII